MKNRICLTKDYIIEETLFKKGSHIIVDEMDIDDVILYEMSRPFNEVAEFISHGNKERLEHLLKLYYYRGQTKYEYDFMVWVISARKGFEKQIYVKKAHGRDTFPQSEKLYKSVWIPYLEKQAKIDYDKLVQKLNRTYEDYLPIIKTNYDDFIKFATEYHKWAFDIIELSGQVECYEAEDKIKELLNLE